MGLKMVKPTFLYLFLSPLAISHAFLMNNLKSTAFVPRTKAPGLARITTSSRMALPFQESPAISNETMFFNTTTASGFNILDEIKFTEATKRKTPLMDPSMLEFVETCSVHEVCSVDAMIKEMSASSVMSDAADETYPYVDLIRGSAPYIANHRGELAVIHIPGDLLAKDDVTDLMNDIALCWLLGMKIVIVAGCRCQVDERLQSKFGTDSKRRGHTRITNEDQFRVIEEEAGFTRFEVERLLHRSLRCSQLSTLSDGNVVSGNFFSATPFGVVDGVDYQSTGRPKKLNVKRVLDYLQSGEIVLMTSVGISSTGEGVNINSECLASFVAASLCANKVVFCARNGMVLRNKATQTTVQNFRAKDANEILRYFDLDVSNDYFLRFNPNDELEENASEMLIKIGWANKAIHDGVERAHIIAPSNGALIEELFTAKQGTGTCISEDSFESVHPEDDSGDFELANEFMYVLNSANDPDWPEQVPKDKVFPWQSGSKHFS
jgi:amino-acid N-acetyltransferase